MPADADEAPERAESRDRQSPFPGWPERRAGGALEVENGGFNVAKTGEGSRGVWPVGECSTTLLIVADGSCTATWCGGGRWGGMAARGCAGTVVVFNPRGAGGGNAGAGGAGLGGRGETGLASEPLSFLPLVERLFFLPSDSLSFAAFCCAAMP